MKPGRYRRRGRAQAKGECCARRRSNEDDPKLTLRQLLNVKAGNIVGFCETMKILIKLIRWHIVLWRKARGNFIAQ